LKHGIISKTLKQLQGKWTFERSISKPALQIKGTATFEELSSNTFSYHECGTYTIDEIAYDFFQNRVFLYDKNTLSIYKNDHSLLHKFDFEGQCTFYPITLSHTHLCGLDTYDCTLIFTAEQCFEIHYKINGANKDYEIVTQYTKN
jgi:hypothetical protein